MKKYPLEVVEYAKSLFLQVDEKGKRVFSLQQIADRCNEKFGTKINKATVKRWADKDGWDKLLKKVMLKANFDRESLESLEKTFIQVAREEEEPDENDKILKNAIRVKRWVLVNHLKMAKKLYNAIQEKETTDRRFARLCEVANQVGKTIYEMISEAEERDEINPPIVIINEIQNVNTMQVQKNEEDKN